MPSMIDISHDISVVYELNHLIRNDLTVSFKTISKISFQRVAWRNW